MSVLEIKLAKIPPKPGVYLFKNKSGETIYIGKSGNLKNRVWSYFNKSAKFFNPAKVKMLADIFNVEIILTDSEIGALIKESELIKKHKPKFNVLMRDSKNYLYVGFTREEFPKIILTHQPIRNWKPARPAGGLEIRNYTGPFTDGTAIRKSLHILREIFPYCTCKQKHNIKCLNAHMGRCLTYCCIKESSEIPRAYDRKLAVLEQYRKNIK
ncbi:MAG: GIY-YIG nuclease family protein, partial [Patescibacteria group bacterium]